MHRYHEDEVFQEPLLVSGQNHDGVRFTRCVFEAEADFSKCTFGGDKVAFVNCTFKGRTSFEQSHFSAKTTIFSKCLFERETNFNSAVFEESTVFEGSRDSKDHLLFNGDVQFKYVTIRKPLEFFFKYVSFEKVELRGTDLKDLRFTSVHWPERPTSFVGRDRLILYDQSLLERDGIDCSSHEFNLLQIAYRELKQNFDNNRFFGPADGFYFREMEMLRLYPQTFRTKYVSWRALYRLTSGYGLFWFNGFLSLLITLFFFPLLFLFSGMEKPFIEYDVAWSLPEFGQSICDYLQLLGYSIFALFNFRDVHALYSPSLCTRLIQILEWILVPTFSTLTILAIRRRFKR